MHDEPFTPVYVSHVVVDTMDGYVFWRGADGLFDAESAAAFAAQRNAEMKPQYQSYQVFPVGSYSRDVVSQALNAGADLVLDDRDLFPYEDGDSIRVRSVVDLVVNAAMSLLDNPALADNPAALDEIIEMEYSTDPDEVRDWIRKGSFT